MPEFMISVRSPANPDAVGPARYLVFDQQKNEQELQVQAWTGQILGQFPKGAPNPHGDPRRQGDVLFLVHGFNVDHSSAVDFHLKCVQQLAAAGWRGQVVSFDWPSDGLVFAYLSDRANARAAASGLVTSGISVLEQMQQDDCAINVHVLSHSMGGFVVQQAFTWAYQDVPPDWKVGQLLFVAADVDYTVFSADTPTSTAFAQHGGRLTAYCNSYDKALLVSNAKRLDLAPRMGRVGLPDDAPSMMCEVDCSALFEKADPGLDQLNPVTTHTFYFDQVEFWQDVVLTLAGGIDRSVFPTRETAPDTAIPNRFALLPDGVETDVYHAALTRAASTPSIGLD